MTRITRTIAILLLWALSADSILAQQPLSWKLTPGETLHYQSIQKTKTTMNLGVSTDAESGNGVSTEVNQTLDMDWLVKEIQEDESALVELDITRIQLNIDGPGGQGLQYDSAVETRPQGFAAMIAGLMKTLAEATYQVTMTPRGEITKVDLPESLLEQVRDAPGGEMMGGLTSEAGFKNLMSQSTLLLPEQIELAIGHEWTNRSTIENPAMGGKQTVKTTYRYGGTQQVGEQSLDVFTMKMAFNFGSGKMPDGASIQILQQQSTGKMLFNRSDGRLESSATELMLQIEIEKEGQKIGQTIEQTVELRRIDKL